MRRVLIAAIAVLLLAAPAGAGTIVVKLALVPGALKIGAARSSPTTISLTIADGRGNGAGWTVRASSPIEVAGITAHCAAHSTCTLPTMSVAPSGQIVLSAMRDSGMGVMNVVVTLKAPVGAGITFRAS